MDNRKPNPLEDSFRAFLAKRGQSIPVKDGEDDGRCPKAILEHLEDKGIILTLKDDRIHLSNTEGRLTPEDRENIKACKTELVIILDARKRAADRAAVPWDDAEAGKFLQEAKAKFKDLWEDLAAKDNPTRRRAALAVLTDAIEMMADAMRVRNLPEFCDKANYVCWVCEQVRSNL